MYHTDTSIEMLPLLISLDVLIGPGNTADTIPCVGIYTTILLFSLHFLSDWILLN